MPVERYHLEVYEHPEADACIVAFSSDTPFLAIHVGDLLDPNTWPQAHDKSKQFRVTGVRHLIFDTDRGPSHKICLCVHQVQEPSNYLMTGNP